jgi:hypothetical protein
VLAIETIILQALIVYLTYREFEDPDAIYSPPDDEYLALKPRKAAGLKVRSIF